MIIIYSHLVNESICCFQKTLQEYCSDSLFTSILDDLKGNAHVWLLGDNFLVETYCKGFKKSSCDFYLKEHYEVIPYCSSRYSDKNTNALSRIVNSFTEALNLKFYLPDYMVVFLDNDLIDYLQYKRFNLASLLGPWIEFLMQLFAKSLQQRYRDLKPKC